MKHSNGWTNSICRAAIFLAVSTVSALGGPNIIAIGNYDSVPYKRAEGRDSASGKEVIFDFADPQYDFGRVVVRSRTPNSIVRRDLFVGFTGGDLRVSTRGGGPGGAGGANVQIEDLEIWLRIKGAIRPGASYEWETQIVGSEQRVIEGGIPSVIPAFWADGQPIGVNVTISEPVREDTDRIERMVYPRGIITMPTFERQTGAAWVVLKPRNFGADIGLQRFSFREADAPPTDDSAATMPTPVRYVSIRSRVADQITEVLERSAEALRQRRSPQGFWGEGTNVDANVKITALIAFALANIDPADKSVAESLKWLSEQKPPDGQAFSVETVDYRLACLARHGGGNYKSVVQADAQFLMDAQLDDGGWGEQSPRFAGGNVSLVSSDHSASLLALFALREARFAGAVIDPKVWRNAMRYWTDAQTFDGGFSRRLDRYGSVSQPTIGYTAAGAAGMMIAVDMAAGMGARRCSTFLANKDQLRGVDRALTWLDERFEEEYRSFGSLVASTDPYYEPYTLGLIGEVSGLSQFNEKNHFVESAEQILAHYDSASGLFGIRGQGGGLGNAAGAFSEQPSVQRTATALWILSNGNAPAVVQRIVVGDDASGWAQYRWDAPHLVRYLASRSGRPFNWRRMSIDRNVRELVETPILLLSVVGPFQWSEAEWNKIREYCFAGGTLVVDIGEDAEAPRAPIEEGLRRAFPEYALAELPADAGVFIMDKSRSAIKGVKAIGNGFRHFAFLPPESWSCIWHLYDTKDHEDAFAFMHSLLNYATDETPPRNSFAPSTYAAEAASSRTMKAASLQVGTSTPAYPNLIATMNRLMQSNFRTAVVETSNPAEADLLWVLAAGDAPPSDNARQQILDAMKGGRLIFVDVVSGNTDWDEGFRAVLLGLDPGVRLQKLRRGDPVFTGEIGGTQGFDAVDVPFRKALHTRFAQSGRCDLYSIQWNGRSVGVYSADDISSGIGFHFFPGCRGVMPEAARRLAMNVFLSAYADKVSGRAKSDAQTRGQLP